MNNAAEVIWALIVLVLLTVATWFLAGLIGHALVDVFMWGWETGR